MTIRTRYGQFEVPENDDMIGRFLRQYGEWADLEVRFIADVISDDTAVADIGAFLGTFGIGLSQRRQLSKVCFFEANSQIVPLLTRNVNANCNAAAVVVEAVVGPSGFEPTASFSQAGNLGSATFSAQAGDRDGVEVPASTRRLTLSDIRREFGEFGLIKLDVEGLELAILADDREYLEQTNATIWMECNENVESLDAAELLLACGMNVFYFAFPSFNSDNFNKNSTPIFPFAYEAGLLALRGEPHLAPALADCGCMLKRIRDRNDLRKALWRTPRGVPTSWDCEYPEEALALALRSMLGERYSRYLSGDNRESEKNSESDEWSLTRDLQDELAHAAEQFNKQTEGIKEFYNGELARIKEHSNYVADLLRWTETLAAHRLVLINVEREQRQQIQQELESIKRSISWRIISRFRRAITRFPLLYRVLRWGLQVGARIARKMKLRS